MAPAFVAMIFKSLTISSAYACSVLSMYFYLDVVDSFFVGLKRVFTVGDSAGVVFRA